MSLNNIPLKKLNPQSPDAVQRVSEQSEMALARFSHLNRLALFLGLDKEYREISVNDGTEIEIMRPCGDLLITDAGLTAGSDITMTLSFNTLGTGATNKYHTTMQVVNPDGGIIVSTVIDADLTDGRLDVQLFNVDAAIDCDTLTLQYTVIPLN